MPSVSQSQQRYFGGILGGEIPKPKSMTMDQVKDFARTPRKGLPERVKPRHMADGTQFVQREGVTPGGAHWMELIRSNTLPDDKLPSERTPSKHMADGCKPHMADGKWMQKAFGHNKGGLHRATHTPAGKPIPASKVRGMAAHGNSHQKHMAQAAINANPGKY